MFIMRALVIALLLLPRVAFAEPPAFNVASSFFSAKGQALVTTAQQANSLSSQTHEVSASTGLVKNKYRVRLKSSQIKRDVTNYFYTDRFGEVVSLSDSFSGEESAIGGGVDLVNGKFTFSVDGVGTVTESPLAATSVVGKVSYSSYDRGTDLSLEFLQQRLSRPESFFRNAETNFSDSVPESLQRQEARLVWGQLLNENLKISSHLVGGKRIQEERTNLGAGIRALQAVSDATSLFASTERRQDIKGTLPEDNRGYFDLTAFEFGIAHEVNYNLLVKIIAGTTVEHESARGVAPRQTVGTDGYAAGLDYRRGRLAAQLFTKVEQSNTGYKAYQVTGGVTWEI